MIKSQGSASIDNVKNHKPSQKSWCSYGFRAEFEQKDNYKVSLLSPEEYIND